MDSEQMDKLQDAVLDAVENVGVISFHDLCLAAEIDADEALEKVSSDGAVSFGDAEDTLIGRVPSLSVIPIQSS